MKHRTIKHYELVRRLGIGGSGVVYLATDTLLMRPVVLKVLKSGTLTLEQMRTTVLREARMASAIEHPNHRFSRTSYYLVRVYPADAVMKKIGRAPNVAIQSRWPRAGQGPWGRQERRRGSPNHPGRASS